MAASRSASPRWRWPRASAPTVNQLEGGDPIPLFFGEDQGRYLVTVKRRFLDQFYDEIYPYAGRVRALDRHHRRHGAEARRRPRRPCRRPQGGARRLVPDLHGGRDRGLERRSTPPALRRPRRPTDSAGAVRRCSRGCLAVGAAGHLGRSRCSACRRSRSKHRRRDAEIALLVVEMVQHVEVPQHLAVTRLGLGHQMRVAVAILVGQHQAEADCRRRPAAPAGTADQPAQRQRHQQHHRDRVLRRADHAAGFGRVDMWWA